ncbi:MAG: dihydrofolate reductase family protein [Prolixibacteraceae bacterium]
MSNERKVILYIAMSLDGFIAAPDGDISFLSVAENGDEDYGYTRFLESVDTVIIGRKTYDKVHSMGFELPYPENDVYVVTRNSRPDEGKVKFYSGDLKELVDTLKTREGKHIYCDGGAETVHRLLQADLIDEMIISVIPVLLGGGISLFGNQFPEKKLELINTASFEKGLVQLHYRCIKT